MEAIGLGLRCAGYLTKRDGLINVTFGGGRRSADEVTAGCCDDHHEGDLLA